MDWYNQGWAVHGLVSHDWAVGLVVTQSCHKPCGHGPQELWVGRALGWASHVLAGSGLDWAWARLATFWRCQVLFSHGLGCQSAGPAMG